jgi:hypothetical protein
MFPVFIDKLAELITSNDFQIDEKQQAKKKSKTKDEETFDDVINKIGKLKFPLKNSLISAQMIKLFLHLLQSHYINMTKIQKPLILSVIMPFLKYMKPEIILIILLLKKMIIY